jgi:hypothetical protein
MQTVRSFESSGRVAPPPSPSLSVITQSRIHAPTYLSSPMRASSQHHTSRVREASQGGWRPPVGATHIGRGGEGWQGAHTKQRRSSALSPVRYQGSPQWDGKSNYWSKVALRGRPISLSSHGRCGVLGERQVAPPRLGNLWSGLRLGRSPPKTHDLNGEDEIQEFWGGQLWLIPHPKCHLQPPRVCAEEKSNLVWVRKDLWERKEFDVGECFPIGDGDI